MRSAGCRRKLYVSCCGTGCASVFMSSAFVSKATLEAACLEATPWRTGGMLSDLPSTRGGAVKGFKWFPKELICKMNWGGGPLESLGSCVVEFRNAGASRVTYLPQDSSLPFAFKLASAAYTTDENLKEWNADVPNWLIPHRMGYFRQALLGVEFSMLVMERMDTVQEVVLKLQNACPDRSGFVFLTSIVCSVFGLMVRVGDARVSTSDWKLDNLGVRNVHGEIEIKLLDFPASGANSVSEYQCVKDARDSFVKSLFCFGPVDKPPAHQTEWENALVAIQYQVAQWWPKGWFQQSNAGIPTQSAVADLEVKLLALHLHDVPGVLASPAAAAAADQTTGDPTPSADSLPVDQVSSNVDQTLSAKEDSPGDHPRDDGAAASSRSVAPDPNWQRDQADGDPMPSADLLPVDQVSSAPEPSADSLPAEQLLDDGRAGRVSEWQRDLLARIENRQSSRNQEVSSADLEEFLFDFRPRGSAMESYRSYQVSADFRIFAAGESRLPVTEGHEPLAKRVMSAGFDYERIKYQPDDGDDLGLFIRLLLEHMPLHTITPKWSTTACAYKPPNNTDPVVFHRKYATALHQMLGGRPPLWRWRDVGVKFLMLKLFKGKPNEFRWENFKMTEEEIVYAATEATYQYGLERMGIS